MHMKLNLALGLGLVAAVSAGSSPMPSGSQQVGKVFEHEYIRPNVEQTCFSTRPIASCDDSHVATHVKYQKVGFHCLNKSSPIAKQFQREADQGQQLPLASKSQDIQAYVEVPVRCSKIDTEEKRLRKETENTAEQKIHIIQSQDGEEESFLSEHRPWTNEQEQSEEQYQRHLIRKSQRQNKQHQLKNGHNVAESDDEELIDEQDLDTMQQYGELINKQTTMHSILKMKDEQFDRLMQHLTFIAHQNRRSDKWSQQLDQVLPNVFSKVAKQFFETVLEKQTTSQQEKEELYEQYKEVVKRIYAYTVKQALQMRQLNQVTGGTSNRRHQNQQQEQQEQKYITNQIARNLWYKIQKELTNKQVEDVRQIVETIQQQKPQFDRMLTEETLVVLNKDQLRQLEKDLTKTLVAGLQMVNHKITQSSHQGKMQSEEYRKYHGQDYEQSFRSQFPKLFQKLESTNKVYEWVN